MDPRTPVIIGHGQFTNNAPQAPELDPIDLMAEALRSAETSTGTSGVLRQVESISVVPVLSWRYGDPAGLVAEAIGAQPRDSATSAMGGHTPILLLNRAARAIAAGDLDVALVVGGEAYRTRSTYRRAGAKPDWPVQPEGAAPTEMVGGAGRNMFHDAEARHGLFMPTQMYPLFENALAHRAGRTPSQQAAWLARWWAGFAEVALHNPYAWRHEDLSAEDIATVTPQNRLVGYPYTKRMVSNPDVDMAAGVIVTSAAKAQSLGVPRDRWIFCHAGTDGFDRLPSTRSDFVSSASMRVAGRRVLDLADRTPDDIDLMDVYSCFPSAVEIAALEMDIDIDRPLTVYGGLCFAGGPWNNPVSHALAAMTDQLRGGENAVGLVTANGGIIQKHGFFVLGSHPPAEGFRWEHPQAEIDRVPAVAVDETFAGTGRIETWTVMFDRNNEPERAHAAIRTPNDARTWAVSDDTAFIAELIDRAERGDDPIGTNVVIGDGSTMTW